MLPIGEISFNPRMLEIVQVLLLDPNVKRLHHTKMRSSAILIIKYLAKY